MWIASGRMSRGEYGAMSSSVRLRELAGFARGFDSPTNYFAGISWSEGLVPDNILCFHRSRQEHSVVGYEGISAKSGKYDQHPRFVLLCCLEDSGSIGVEHDIFNLSAGHAILVFPHQLHYYTELPEKFLFLFVTFDISREAVSEIAGLRSMPKLISPDVESRLRNFLACYEKGTVKASSESALNTSRSLQSLLYAIRDAPDASGAKEKSGSAEGTRATVHLIKRYIYGNLDRNINIADIAAHVGFSESYVRAAFKEHIGISLGQFVLAVRLTHSTNLLRTSEEKIGAISEACGFESQLSFSRAFKRTYGITPREYRKSA